MSASRSAHPDKPVGRRATDTPSSLIGLIARLPSLMTHASVSAEDRAKLGIDDELVRLSCGIEDVRDLEGDLQAAASKVLKL